MTDPQDDLITAVTAALAEHAGLTGTVCAECAEWRPRRWLARQPEDDPRGNR